MQQSVGIAIHLIGVQGVQTDAEQENDADKPEGQPEIELTSHAHNPPRNCTS
jgi:hypothetical protein